MSGPLVKLRGRVAQAQRWPWNDKHPIVRRNFLKGMVGAWGFEPQTPTVSTIRPTS
jgi:hypothetical protein